MEGMWKAWKNDVIKTAARFRARISIRAPIPFINQGLVEFKRSAA